jgi:hypothetical protein
MKANSPGASAPVSPIDPNTLCTAIDLLDQAYAISVFMAGSIGHGDADLSDKGRFGFHLIMFDMADRIKQASFLVDEYREGASHG